MTLGPSWKRYGLFWLALALVAGGLGGQLAFEIENWRSVCLHLFWAVAALTVLFHLASPRTNESLAVNDAASDWVRLALQAGRIKERAYHATGALRTASEGTVRGSGNRPLPLVSMAR